jgi:acetylornithine deacetylase/succinyl-diaminopimelate desuccinylase-like protein
LIDAALRSAGGRRRTLEFEGLPNLVADWGGADDDRRLILAGHTDVVPAEGEWETAPFSLVRQGDSLIGCGVCDMKGALAAYVGALEALEMTVSDLTAVRVDGEPAINTIPDAVWPGAR